MRYWFLPPIIQQVHKLKLTLTRLVSKHARVSFAYYLREHVYSLVEALAEVLSREGVVGVEGLRTSFVVVSVVGLFIHLSQV